MVRRTVFTKGDRQCFTSAGYSGRGRAAHARQSFEERALEISVAQVAGTEL